MSDDLKTIKELADELGVSKKYLQNKISYETKKQGLSIGDWKIISGKKTRILSDKEQAVIKGWLDKHSDSSDSLEDKHSDSSDSLGDKHSDSDIFHLKERIISLETFLNKEQEANSELRTIIQQTQNLLDQQQRLALQDKKLLEEYKEEINDLKALKIPVEDAKQDKENNVQEEVEKLKAQLNAFKEQRVELQEKEVVKPSLKKWWQLWK